MGQTMKKPVEEEKGRPYTSEELRRLKDYMEVTLGRDFFDVYSREDDADFGSWRIELGRWNHSPVGQVLRWTFLLSDGSKGGREKSECFEKIGNVVASKIQEANSDFFESLANYLKGKSDKKNKPPSRARMKSPPKMGRGEKGGELEIVFPLALAYLIAKRVFISWFRTPPKKQLTNDEIEAMRQRLIIGGTVMQEQDRPKRITRTELQKTISDIREERFPDENWSGISDQTLSRWITKWKFSEFME
jgi:hypothetical protein